MKTRKTGILALVIGIALVFAFTACDDGNGGGGAGTYKVGDTGPGGGKIFYASTKGFTVEGYGSPGDPGYFETYTAYYLEAAPENDHTSSVIWGDYGILVAGISTTGTTVISAGNYDGNIPFIGRGRKDTMTIVAHMNGKEINNTAAQYCVAYRGPENLDDWFLPSLSELSMYYYSSVTVQKPSSGYFWSSSQGDSRYAWYFSFVTGGRGGNLKGITNSVRAVRAF